jgi:Uma2 family endonuclease
MATIPKVVSYEEWLHMPVVEDCIEEVVNGEVRIIPPNKWESHSVVVDNLHRILGNQLDSKTVRVVDTVFGLVISETPLTCRVPDLAVFRKQNIITKDGYGRSAPELIVEVLSPANARRDKAEKLSDYERIRVPEVWVVSPEARTVEVLKLLEVTLQTTALLQQGQLRPVHFPEAVVDIASIWDE